MASENGWTPMASENGWTLIVQAWWLDADGKKVELPFSGWHYLCSNLTMVAGAIDEANHALYTTAKTFWENLAVQEAVRCESTFVINWHLLRRSAGGDHV